MSGTCHEPTSLFDHLVGAGEQRWRYCQAKHPGGLDVDNQLEFGGLHNRQVCGLGALEDTASVNAELMIGIRQARAIADQPASLGDTAYPGRNRDRMVRRQVGKLHPSVKEKRIAADEQYIGSLAR